MDNIINNITITPNMIIISINYIAVGLSILSNYLVAKKISFAPILWSFATAILFIIAIIQKNYPNVLLFGIYEILNIYMSYKWNEIKIQHNIHKLKYKIKCKLNKCNNQR